MKIAVFVKQVDDARTARIDGETSEAFASGEPVMNPVDAHVVSEAIDLREAITGEVTAVTLGPKSARDVVMDALATGADKGVHVLAEGASEADSRVVANCLADAIRNEGYDLYLAGKDAMDYGTGQVGVQIAEALGVPHIANVLSISVDGDTLTVRRDLDGFPDELQVKAPVMLVFAESEDAPKRHPSLRGMMQAKRKPVEEVAPSEEIATALSWSVPTAQRSSADRILLEGEPVEEMAAKLASWLREHRLVG